MTIDDQQKPSDKKRATTRGERKAAPTVRRASKQASKSETSTSVRSARKDAADKSTSRTARRTVSSSDSASQKRPTQRRSTTSSAAAGQQASTRAKRSDTGSGARAASVTKRSSAESQSSAAKKKPSARQRTDVQPTRSASTNGNGAASRDRAQVSGNTGRNKVVANGNTGRNKAVAIGNTGRNKTVHNTGSNKVVKANDKALSNPLKKLDFSAPAPKKNLKGPSDRTAGGAGTFKAFYLRYIKVMLPITIALALIIVGGVVDVAASFGKIHPGVKVEGVNVGGMAVDEAATVLDEELSASVSGASINIYATKGAAESNGVVTEGSKSTLVKVTYDSELAADVSSSDGANASWNTTSDNLGAHTDGAYMAEQAYEVGRDGPLFIFARIGAWLGISDLDGRVACDSELYNEFCTGINDTCGTELVESNVNIADGVASLSQGNDGVEVDKDQLLADISYAVFNRETPDVIAPMGTVIRHIQPETAQKVVDQVNSGIKGGITVTYNGESWTLDETATANLVSTVVLSDTQVLVLGDMTQSVQEKSNDVKAVYDVSTGTDSTSGWILQAYINQESANSYLVGILGDKAEGGAVSASFDVSSGSVVINPSSEGLGPDRAAACLNMQDIVFGNASSRTVAMEDTVIQPSLTTEQAEAMGIKERLASWSIPLSGTESRINNITLLCSMINDSLVAPGQVWSFNGTTGERTAEKGFETAPVIIDGVHVDQLGGGICQVATCVYNCACYSGLGINTRSNHTTYIATYDDEGFADATVSWKEPDLAWNNDTDNYIYISAGVYDGNVVVSFWGTDDGRVVTCERGEWKEGDKFKTVRENDDEMAVGQEYVEQSGVDGRSIDIRYTVVKDGKTIHDITFHSVYAAQDEIIKVGTKT